LLKGLVGNFWDTLYPEIEDGDLEMRAAPLDWVGGRLEKALKDAPLTRSGYSWFDYKNSRKVPTEGEAEGSEEKAEQRQAAIAEGKPAPEEFDKSFAGSPKAYYVQLSDTFESALESLQALDELCTEKFQDYAPTFGGLRQAVEEVQQAVRMFLQRKREIEPDEPVAEEAAAEEATGWEEPAAEESSVPQTSGAAAAPARARIPGATLSAQPADRSDAIARVAAAAKFLRQENAYDPAPYLMLRGLRWGELRAGGESIDAALLAAPPTEVRQDLKRLAMEGNWTEVLETAETAMAMECGRGWLDVQRYVCRACYELGSYYEPIRAAVISGLRGLLADYPDLPGMAMMDDTAAANPETAAWIKEEVQTAPAAGQAPAPPPAWDDSEPEAAPGEPAPPDVFELALQALQAGRPQEGIEMMMREMLQESTGRGRFQRRAQLAQLCMGAGRTDIALAILQELAAEIEKRKLEDWEAPGALAHPLAMLYRCMSEAEGDQEQRNKLYSWICRLDPVQALDVSR
jgi:type VI secretion system protein ImpA